MPALTPAVTAKLRATIKEPPPKYECAKGWNPPGTGKVYTTTKYQ